MCGGRLSAYSVPKWKDSCAVRSSKYFCEAHDGFGLCRTTRRQAESATLILTLH